MTEIFCPNCEMNVNTILGNDKQNHYQYCGIVLEKPKSFL